MCKFVFILIVKYHKERIVNTRGTLGTLRGSECWMRDFARPAFFFATLRLFEVFGLRDWDLDPTLALQKIRDCETFRTVQKSRLRDPWNLTKILQDLYFFRDHPPLLLVGVCCPVLQIQTLLQTNKCHFPHPFSDLGFWKLYSVCKAITLSKRSQNHFIVIKHFLSFTCSSIWHRTSLKAQNCKLNLAAFVVPFKAIPIFRP